MFNGLRHSADPLLPNMFIVGLGRLAKVSCKIDNSVAFPTSRALNARGIIASVTYLRELNTK